MADLKLAIKNCIKLVEKTHATENEKSVGQYSVLSNRIFLACSHAFIWFSE